MVGTVARQVQHERRESLPSPSIGVQYSKLYKMGGSGGNNGREDQTMGGNNGSRHSNYKNALIAFLVPLPSILFYFSFLNQYNNNPNTLSPFWDWCYQHPLLLAHLLFFLNVNVLFWVIGLIQSSHWVCRYRSIS